MKSVFRTRIKNITINDKGETKDKKSNLLLKLDFGGFKKMSLEAKTCATKTFEFNYSTLYPDFLKYKFFTVKCFRHGSISQTLVGEKSISLYFLATGPSKYTLDISDSVALGMICEMTQVCSNFSCTLSNIEYQTTTAPHTPLTKAPTYHYDVKIIAEDEKKSRHLVQNKEGWLITENATVDELEHMAFHITISGGSKEVETSTKSNWQCIIGLLTNYDAAKVNLGHPIPIEAPVYHIFFADQILVNQTVSCVGRVKALLSYKGGPMFHQMSGDCLASEKGVICGEITPGYPDPNMWVGKTIVKFRDTQKIIQKLWSSSLAALSFLVPSAPSFFVPAVPANPFSLKHSLAPANPSSFKHSSTTTTLFKQSDHSLIFPKHSDHKHSPAPATKHSDYSYARTFDLTHKHLDLSHKHSDPPHSLAPIVSFSPKHLGHSSSSSSLLTAKSEYSILPPDSPVARTSHSIPHPKLAVDWETMEVLHTKYWSQKFNLALEQRNEEWKKLRGHWNDMVLACTEKYSGLFKTATAAEKPKLAEQYLEALDKINHDRKTAYIAAHQNYTVSLRNLNQERTKNLWRVQIIHRQDISLDAPFFSDGVLIKKP